MGKIQDHNYFQISGWMVNHLGLKDKELMTYAIIYSFSQDGESEFTGSLNYLCDFVGTTKPTIIKVINNLIEKNYITKNQIEINGVRFNRYRANLEILRVVKNLNEGSKETLRGSKVALPIGSKETLPNNKNNNKNINNKNNNKYIGEAVDELVNDEDIKEVINDFIEMRKTMKKPMTVRAVKMLINKLNRLSEDKETQIKILEQSILHNWLDVYELKEDKSGKYGGNSGTRDGSEYAEFD